MSLVGKILPDVNFVSQSLSDHIKEHLPTTSYSPVDEKKLFLKKNPNVKPFNRRGAGAYIRGNPFLGRISYTSGLKEFLFR